MTKTTCGRGLFASALVLLAGVFSLNAQNGIEPRYEKYNADRKSIEVDGDLSDWAGVTFIEPRFEASDGRETGKGNVEIDGTTYSTFAEFAGGTWSGPDDHSTSIAVAWDHQGLYLGIVVTDDEHEHAAGNAWNGDGVQMGLTDPERETVTHLYNYCIRDGYESGKVYKNGDAGIIADKERGPGNYSVAMVRDDAAKTTTYEALFAPDSFGFEQFEIGQQFGFGVCVNDGDKDTPGQKGWSGWGPHMIVFGKTAPDAALVTLTGLEVISSFSEDFNGEDGEISELITLEGTAAVSEEGELRITEAANSQNGGALLEDFSDGAAFSNFEISLRLFMGDGTARPADGFSISIDNDLPNLASPAEEGAGNGMKICFDAWDSGGGDLAPQIEVFYGGESQAMQSFTGTTDVPEEDRFADEDGNLVTLWDNEEWADVKISVIDGLLNLDFRGHTIFKDKVISSGTFEGPSWLFAARTGGANQKHYIDDLNITLYSAGGPLVTSFNGGPGGFDVSIADAEDNGVDLDSVAVVFDGEAVEVAKSKTDGVTSVKYSLDAPLAAGSEHTAELSFSDEKGSVKTLPLKFTVGNYVTIDPSAIADSSLKGESGFIANITQISTEQTGGPNNLHGNQIVNAEKQINGEYIDANTEEPYLNEADPDAFEGWSYYPVIVETVNQNQDAPAEVGNFRASNDREDEEIPGIPGWGGSTDGIAGEYIALLDLEKGSYTLGVNSDDGFEATIGANFGDLGAQSIGRFNGGRGASDTIFEIYVQEAGLYPFRVIWFEGGGGANVEIFSVVPGAGKTLINDPEVEGSIKAYTINGATVDESTTDRVDTGRAVIVSHSPANGDTLVKSKSIEVVAKNGSKTSIDQGSIEMKLNGEVVTPSVSKDGDNVVITLAPDGGLPVGAHTVEVSMKESNGSAKSLSFGFAVPAIYVREGDVPTEAQGGLTVREYHGIGTTSIATLKAQAKFPDSPDVAAIAPYFEWPQSGDIEVNPAGNVRDNYGWHLMGYIHPPETGEYIFSVATDDNSELWLSTDSDPANAVQITQESQWQGVRNFQPVGDETTSSPVFLEKGKTYFIECFAKEGGGGDNMAVAWSLPSDEGVEAEAGALPISGEYLSPFTWTGPETPELGKTSPAGVTNSTDFSAGVTVNNGQNVKVAEFTKFEVGGKDVLGDAEVTLGGISSSISVDASGDAAQQLVAMVEWKNSDGTTGSASWEFMTSPHSEDTLYIETEDFNYDGGEWFTFEDSAGGGAYEGLGAVSQIDFNNSGNASPNYRDIEGNHPGMADSTGFDGNRGDFDMDIDFKTGWNDNGDWYNYTRDFPEDAAYYNVLGRFSSGGGPIDNKLSIVTSDPTEEGQEITDVGVFKGPRTAGWNNMEFFALQDASGNLAAVKIGGETTLRLTKVGGNMDSNYMAFVKAAVQEYPPVFVSASPTGVQRSSTVDLSVTLTKREQALSDAQLSVDGNDIATKVSTDGDTITITGTVTGASGSHTAKVSYNGTSNEWSFKVPALYSQGAAAGSAAGLTGLEYHGIGTTSIATLQAQDKYPDSPDAQAVAPYFEWPQSGDIEVNPAGNVRDNYGWVLIGYIHPPETGEYVFHVATDDNSQLWLSTDENPANAVQIAQESQWQGIRNFQAEGDESVSAPVALEAGKAYFIELVTKEGGGGDNAAVAWRLADDADVGAGALPISGDHLSQWLVDAEAVSDISSPGDSVTATSGNSPGGEQAPNAIDNNPNTKYLNFDKANTGLTIATAGSIVTGLGLTSANDAPERDPATFVLSGSVDGVNFTEIASGDVPSFGARFERQEVSFANDTAYNTYKLIFPTVVNPDAANSMQIAEVELLGVAAEVATPPSVSVVRNADGTVTVTFEGTLQTAPTVNGPWTDVDAESPLTLNPDQAAAFGRAKK